METLVQNGSAETALDYMQSEANQNENGSWSGLYGFFLKGGKDKNHVLNRLKRDLKMQFKTDVKLSNDHYKLDKFLPDYDIKEIVKDFFEAKSWSNVPLESRKVFFKDNFGFNFIPTCSGITQEPPR